MAAPKTDSSQRRGTDVGRSQMSETSRATGALCAGLVERRRVQRSPALGRVVIVINDPLETTLEARLVDSSSHGFRVIHESKELLPGLEVQYRSDSGAGRARIIWTHI